MSWIGEGFRFLPFDLVEREQWGAHDPNEEELPLSTPVAYVLHTYTDTEPCFERGQCIKRMKMIQARDLSLGMPDIRYNFVIGGDSSLYVGRGWTGLPDMHEDYPHLYERNIEIAHIGFKGEPSDEMRHVLRHFLKYGIKKNRLKSDFKYITHFQEIIKDEEHFQLDESGQFALTCYKKLGVETEKEEEDDYKVLGDVSLNSYDNALAPTEEEDVDLGIEEYYDIEDGIKVDGSLLDPEEKAKLKRAKIDPAKLEFEKSINPNIDN